MIRERFRIGDQEVQLESGRIARQAGGAVILTVGELVLFAVATADRAPTRLSYMPLTTDFRLRFSAAGLIPGGYDRREARASDPETIASRLIDRSIRPFFPAGWAHDTQVIVHPLSWDPEADPGVLGIGAAAAALVLSDVPWGGPVAGVRIARVEGRLVAFPKASELAASDLDLVVSVSREGIVMVEGGGDEVPDETVLEALALARSSAAELLATLEGLSGRGRPKRAAPSRSAGAPEQAALAKLEERVVRLAAPRVQEALAIDEKLARHAALEAVGPALEAELRAELRAESAAESPGDDPAGPEAEGLRAQARAALARLEKRLVRERTLDGRRIGGRGPKDIRAIDGGTGWLPRCHGSSLFTRGETQAIVTCTLGTGRDAKTLETLAGREVERFLLHYSFPPYSVAEVKPMRGPGRREIGHGHLARRALLPVLPSEEEAPYTIRLESLITESNGSSSMATVCGGTLALLDAGLDLKRPVAGIAMGLVVEGERAVVLSDILGDEDHVGDMDFKVCGSERGVTAIQLDNKLGSVPDALMREALLQAREGRLAILKAMADFRSERRPGAESRAPRARALRIETTRIGSLVGSGGKTIRALEADLGVKVEILDDGRVRVFAGSESGLARAESRVRDLAGIPRLGEVVSGVVVGVQPFGSFVRLHEGVEGLLQDEQHPMSARLTVRATGVSERGKIVLQRA